MAQLQQQTAGYYNQHSGQKAPPPSELPPQYEERPGEPYGQHPYQQQPYQQQPYQQPYQQQGYQQQPYHEQPYQPSPPANGFQGDAPAQHGPNDEKYTFDQAFKVPKPKWNDLWAGILLIAVFLGYAAVSAIAIRGYATTLNVAGGGIYNGRDTFSLTSNTIILFALTLVVAIVLGYGYVCLARRFAKQFIWITGILNIVFAFGTAIYMLIRRYWSGGIVFLIFGIFLIIAFISWIPRIPFSALMLRISVDVAKRYGHVYLVSFLGGLVAAAFAAWYAVTLVAITVTYTPDPNNPACARNGCSQAKVIGLIAFVTFAMYWISEWIKNTIHTTISGVYGSWYFYPRNLPNGATRGALKRALTHSFGSISLGSLLVAIIQFLRQLCTVAQQQEAAQGNIFGTIVFCCMGCLISILEWAAQFLNRYAFSYIALYGKPYIEAAKATWKMIKDRGIDALINECLIGPVLSFGAIFVGYACALLAFLYLIFTRPAYNRTGGYTPLIVAFSFLIGLQITNIFTTPLMSGIDAIFVASAWDPEVLMREHTDIYDEMVRVYPNVATAIHA